MERKIPAPSFRVPAPAAGLVAGARPVVGALGACGLMLLACSWFAFGAGGLSPFHRDVGSTAPVRIQTPAGAAAAPAHKAPAVTPTRRAANRQATHADVSQSVGVARAPQPASGRPTPAPAPPAAPDVSRPAAAPAQATAPTPAPTQSESQVQASPTPPPALPAPPDNVPLPAVSLPPISLPALPTVTVQVPVLPTTTLPLGLP